MTSLYTKHFPPSTPMSLERLWGPGCLLGRYTDCGGSADVARRRTEPQGLAIDAISYEG